MFDIKNPTCNHLPKVTPLDITHDGVVHAWAYGLCVCCYEKELEKDNTDSFNWVIMNNNHEYWTGTFGKYAYKRGEIRPDFHSSLIRAHKMSEETTVGVAKIFNKNYAGFTFIATIMPEETT